jgi:hypothetical protein
VNDIDDKTVLYEMCRELADYFLCGSNEKVPRLGDITALAGKIYRTLQEFKASNE